MRHWDVCDTYNFSGQLYFWRSYFSHFFGARTLSQQLHFRSSYFFRAAAFFSFSQNSHFFAAAIFFQNSFYFRANIHFLSIRSSLWQLLFGTAFFPLFWIKISKKELLSQSSCTVSTFPEKLHVGKS